MNYKILYGTAMRNIDITSECMKKCMKENVIRLPPSDFKRAFLFTDPCIDILKTILIMDNTNNLIGNYDHNTIVYINCDTHEVFTNHKPLPEYIKTLYPDYTEILKTYHETLQLDYGSFQDEYPEQLLATEYITGNEKILEIGGNIGRNSVIMGHLLNKHNSTNLVTLECCEPIATQLIHNRNKNHLFFHVECAALSKRTMYQHTGHWQTVVSDVPIEGHTKLRNISFDELQTKYNITFDTLVMDCEGAFYYILKDMPEILQNIRLIIMENDYNEIEHKEFVDKCLTENGLQRVHWEAGGWGPCFDRFYEVWKRLD
jgi:FkbM family methyltransferase